MEAKITVKGAIPLDERESKLKQVWYLCNELEIPVPINILEHFDGDMPLTAERHVDIVHEAWTRSDYLHGVNIHTVNIPKDVTRLGIQISF